MQIAVVTLSGYGRFPLVCAAMSEVTRILSAIERGDRRRGGTVAAGLRRAAQAGGGEVGKGKTRTNARGDRPGACRREYVREACGGDQARIAHIDAIDWTGACALLGNPLR